MLPITLKEVYSSTRISGFRNFAENQGHLKLEMVLEAGTNAQIDWQSLELPYWNILCTR